MNICKQREKSVENWSFVMYVFKSKGHNFVINHWIKTKLNFDLYLGMAKQCTKYTCIKLEDWQSQKGPRQTFQNGTVSFVSSKISMKQSIQRMCFAFVKVSFWKEGHIAVGQGHGIKWKVLPKGIHMWNMNALSPIHQMLWLRLKILKRRPNSKVKDRSVKVMISKDRSYQKEYTIEIWKPYYLPIKSYDQG
jgi:hypothetical protein